MMKKNFTELYHHGVKGMRWGVRRYQNRDGTLTALGREHLTAISSDYNKKVQEDLVLKRGHKFDRIGTEGEDQSGSTFVSYTKNDRITYRASTEVLPLGVGKTLAMTLAATKDLRVAGAKAQVDALLEYASEKPLSKTLSNSAPTERARKLREKEYSKTLQQILKGKGNYEDLFDEAFSKYVDRNSDINIAITKKLQQKGYDAVIDLWDVGLAECPIYVFDRGSSLKTVSKKELTQKDKDKAIEEYWKRESART